MKETERRADKWRERFGVEQTEIDALATLRPQQLAQIVEEAVAPYWDQTLDERRIEAVREARKEAQQILAGIIAEKRERIDGAEAMLAKARAAANKVEAAIVPILTEIHAEATAAFREVSLETPEAAPEGDVDVPLFCSARDWVEQTKILRGEKL
jgi:hypothetical protein